MLSTILKVLKDLGLTGSTVIIVGLGLFGYFKLARNHFKHLNDRFTGLEKGQKCLDTKIKAIKGWFVALDKKVGILEALNEKDKK